MMMLHLLISLAYYEPPTSMATGPQGIKFSTIWTAVQDRNAGFPLLASQERQHMGRCPLSAGVESPALHTHVSCDTTLTLAPSSASHATPQGAPTRPDGDNAHATCSTSASHRSHSLSMSGTKGVLTPQHTTRSRASGHSAHTLSAASADPSALCQRPGGLAVQVGQRPSSPLANHSHLADANNACDVQCFPASNADLSAASTPPPPFSEPPLIPTAGTLLSTAVEPTARLRRSLAQQRFVVCFSACFKNQLL